MLGQDDRLLGERAHLVVEHESAASALAARVVDARDVSVVRPVADEQAVIADRRADDDEHAGIDELVEVAVDVVGGAARKAGGLPGHELHGPVELDLSEAHTHGLLEAGPAVVLGEVVEDPDEQGGSTHRTRTIILLCASRRSWPSKPSDSATAW